MGNLHRPPAHRPLSHYTLSSNVVQLHIAPPAPKSVPAQKTIECQVSSAILASTAVEVLDSPKSEPYSGSLESMISSANVSNKNVAGQQGYPNSSQHIDSQVISNFLSGIVGQPDPPKQQRKTEYSQGKEEDTSLHMTN